MEKIRCFIECLLPVTACNLKCSYCYVIQRDNRKMEVPKLQYDIETIGKALSKKRFGGTCLFSICGAGETLVPDYSVELIREILQQGHFVNITTNGTLNNRFDAIIQFEPNLLKRLNFSFSLHYLELIRLNKLNDFFNNIKKIKDKGCSFVLQLNLCDEYVPYIDEIKEVCKKEVGAYPQIAVTRKEDKKLKKIEILTNNSLEKYIENGKKFESPLFDFTLKNMNVKRNEFCYAGDWSFALNILNGELRKCYCYPIVQNIYEDINKPIKFEAIGKNCNSSYCFNSSHFLSFGVIPEMNTPTYGNLRNREEAMWYSSKEIIEAFNSKLKESNKEYSTLKKFIVNIKNKIILHWYSFRITIKKIIKKIVKIIRGKNERK